MQTTDWIILVVVVAIVAIIIGYCISFFVKLALTRKAEAKIKEAEKQAKKIINSAKADARVEVAQLRNELAIEVEKKRKEFIESEEFYKLRDNNLRDREGIIEKKEKELNKQRDLLLIKHNECQAQIDQVSCRLAEVAGYSVEQARQELFDQIKQQSATDFNKYLKNQDVELRLAARQHAVDIISQAMERYAIETVTEKTSSVVSLPSDEMKGRIIGKEGRNIKSFENATGVDLIIDDTQGVVTLSSFDPIRREIAYRAMNKLVMDGRIQPTRIEKVVEEEEKELENIILEAGKSVLQELNIFDMELDEIRHLGMLKYRTSFGQNVLQHSIEVAKLSGAMAFELGLDGKLAMRAGLLHDIGKSVDKEQEGSHVTLGVRLALKWGEDPIIVHAIHAHHGEVQKNSAYAVIVMIADELSAARPGARNNNLEDYITRLHDLEKMCSDMPGVDKVYAMQAGRQIRIMVKPDKVDDEQTALLAFEIKQKIKQQKSIPGDIIITVIRELRIQETVI